MIVYNEDFKPTSEQLQTFIEPPKRILLEEGNTIYSFTGKGQAWQNKTFWFDFQTFNQIKHLMIFDPKPQAFLSNVARSWTVFRKEWNTGINQICVVSLLYSYYAWVGEGKVQAKANGEGLKAKQPILFNQILLPNVQELEAKVIHFKSGTDTDFPDFL